MNKYHLLPILFALLIVSTWLLIGNLRAQPLAPAQAYTGQPTRPGQPTPPPPGGHLPLPSDHHSVATSTIVPPPSKDTPPDGATDQPSPLTLKWIDNYMLPNPPHAGTGIFALNRIDSWCSYGFSYCIDADTDNVCNSGWHDVGLINSGDISKLSPSTTYSWQVFLHVPSCDQYYADNGVWWRFTTGAGEAPGALGKISPSDSATSIPTNVTLTWDASDGATGYDYCLDTIDNGVCDSISDWIDVGNDTSAKVGSLDYNTTYYWQVRAYNDWGTYADDGTWWRFSTPFQTCIPLISR